MDFIKELNKNQQEAVAYIDGPSLVIAGAGSGKTRVLTYKIAYLISIGLRPERILALTFTNKAADEMKNRIDSLLGSETSKYLYMNTFHSIFSRFLRREAESIGFDKNFTINDSDDSLSFLKSVIKNMNLDTKIYEPKKIANKISNCKNNLILPDNYANNYENLQKDRRNDIEYFYLIYKKYFELSRNLNVMDFDDLLLYMYIMLYSRADLLEKYQNHFDFILVDEYQDTNLLQYHILKKLAEKHHKITVVGDDSQSIYSFRCARIENILNFQNDYREAKIFKLTENYRSTQNIVNIANILIAKNKNRIPKTVFSNNEEGSKITYQCFMTDKEESSFLSEKILSLTNQKKFNYKDFAVLYRSNSQSRVLEEYLRKYKIPYKIYSGISFYQRKEIKDALAYLRFIVNRKDIEAFNRIINYPSRKIGDVTINKIAIYSFQNNISIDEAIQQEHLIQTNINKPTIAKISTFRELIEKYRQDIYKLDAYELAKKVLDESGLIDELKADNSPEGKERFENVIELLNGIKDFTDNPDNKENGNNNIVNYLETISVLTTKDDTDDKNDDFVSLMTVHSSKGLEFNNIFIIGMEQNTFPSFFSTFPNEVEEERRLFYVAITRAKKNVFISRAENKYSFGSLKSFDESIFIEDIKSEYLVDNSIGFGKSFWENSNINFKNNLFRKEEDDIKETYVPHKVYAEPKKLISIKDMEKRNLKSYDNSGLTPGMKVKHEKLGFGEVISLYEDRIKISFNGEEKTLLAKYAKLEIIQ